MDGLKIMSTLFNLVGEAKEIGRNKISASLSLVKIGKSFECASVKKLTHGIFSLLKPCVIWQVEIEELRQLHQNDSSASNAGAEKLKEGYLQKLNVLELQVSEYQFDKENEFCNGTMVCYINMLLQVAELKKKINSQSQFSTQRKRVDEATKQSQFEIQSLKAQKVSSLCG